MMFATSSSIGTPRKMILSIIRRLKTSIDATFSFLSSMMLGLIYPLTALSYLCSVIELMPCSRRAYLLNSLFIFCFLFPTKIAIIFLISQSDLPLFAGLLLEDQLDERREVSSPDFPFVSAWPLLPNNTFVSFFVEDFLEFLHAVDAVVLLAA